MTQAAVFLDRDGTVIEDAGYLSDPAGVKLLPGSVEGLSMLSQAGYMLVVVSNQSGVARGLFDEAAVQRVNTALQQQLAEHGVKLAGMYYCPYWAGGSRPQ